ncbi:hypothetical protein GCM10009808_17440 [Microbacterium sediminicola]|uniref:DUF2207 domain-containing protein n=1 Tax=Microbacterium sediminicola TaxID=415210 RepID=A0ABP4U7Y0_9MICO
MRALTVKFRLVGAVLAVFVAVGALVVLGAGTARADVDDFTFESLDVQYTLGRTDDGVSTLTVVETFVALFPEDDQNRGMRRIIPDSYLGAPLHPHLVSITDGDGSARSAEVDTDDGVYVMTSRADDYVHGAQTYVFTYTLENVIHYFPDADVDEFYWNVNGLDWSQPFGEVTATLIVPSDLVPALTGEAACYAGDQGDSGDCLIQIQDDDGGATVTASTAGLAAQQTLTMAVGFSAGTFAAFDASYFASPWGWLQALALIGLTAALVAAIVVRARFLRDAPGRPTIIAEYAPPARIDALESAVLLGKSSKAVPAEVLEQAVVGSIQIIEGRRRKFGGVTLTAKLVDPSRADGDGRILLSGLFPAQRIGEEYEFGKQNSRLSSVVRRLLKDADRELGRRGMRRTVSARVRIWPIAGAVVFGALTILFGLGGMNAYVDGIVPFAAMFFAAVCVVVIVALASRRPLSSAGAEARDHLRGLEVFITWAEADRIRMLQSPTGAERVAIDDTGERVVPANPRQMLKIYETLLPYAVVFGQEKEWAERLAVLYDQTNRPGWYIGTTGFSAAAFSSGISSLTTTASASTSSGSSGGGGAGGGGGGGGGGGV